MAMEGDFISQTSAENTTTMMMTFLSEKGIGLPLLEQMRRLLSLEEELLENVTRIHHSL